MPIPDRRARQRATLRREILDAANRLFVEEGYDRVTMRRVAARIEYSPTTIYLHFKDKRELFGAICDETFSQLAAKLERLKVSHSSPVEHLRAALHTYIEFGTAHPYHYAVTFLKKQEPSEHSRFETSTLARALDSLRETVEACVASGAIRTDSVDKTTQALWASIHGLTSLFITMKDFPFVPRQALIDHTLDALIAGVRAAAGTPAPRPAAKLTFLD